MLDDITRYSVSDVSVKLHILIRVKIVTRFSFSEVSVKLHILIPVKIVAMYGGWSPPQTRTIGINKFPYTRGWVCHGFALYRGMHL